MPLSVDRELLGVAGSSLSDEHYLEAVAGAGVLRETWSSLLRPVHHLSLGWSAGNFERTLELLRGGQGAAELLQCRLNWVAHKADTDGRLLVEASSFQEDAPPDLIQIARTLSHPALAVRAVLIEIRLAQADFRWQWPLRLAAFPEDLEPLGLNALCGQWPSKALVEVRPISREDGRSEVLVIRSDIRGALRRLLELRHTLRTGYLLLLGPLDMAWRDARPQLDALLSETQAGGLSVISGLAQGEVPPRLNDWVRRLSHNEPFDLALADTFPCETSIHFLDRRLIDQAALPAAARRLGRRLQELPTGAGLALRDDTAARIGSAWTSTMAATRLGAELQARAHALPFDQESQGATAIAEIARAERESRRKAAATESRRYLQGDVFWLGEGKPVAETRGLCLGQRYQLDVLIAELGEAALRADAAFPDDTLDWQERDAYRLQVIFSEPQQWDTPFRGRMDLPRRGPSSRCSFVFSPSREGPFAGRVTVLYRGRILQTAVLETAVVASPADLQAPAASEPMRLRVETILRRGLTTLDDRRRFDACLLLNHTAGHTGAMTAAAKDGAYVSTLAGLAPQLANINARLNTVAHKAKVHGGGLTHRENAKLLVDLAIEGSVLYRNLVVDYVQQSSAAAAIQASEFLQIVSTQPDALVPLEFVYEYRPPKKGAPVCGNAKEALRTGRCPASCVPTTSPAPHVCPMGFWGLSKVIERHVHDPALAKDAKILSEPVAGRNTLPLKGATLLAMSEQLRGVGRSWLGKRVKSAWKGQVTTAKSWADWKRAVGKTHPVLLVALPHASGSGARISLEIDGDVLESVYIDPSYVRVAKKAPPPLALLLGCDTANVAYTDAYARHVAAFRQADAALVVGTVATVLAQDAATMAGRLVEHLADAARSKPGCFGEVLRLAKRRAIADSLMIALCLVAFGDADWQLGPP